jgi:hypothetical protein
LTNGEQDSEYARDQTEAIGFAQGHVPEERSDRRQARVAGPDAILPIPLKVVEEGQDRGCVEIHQVETGWRNPDCLVDEIEQQAERVAVSGARLRTCASLAQEVLDKEVLKEGTKRRRDAHCSPPCVA